MEDFISKEEIQKRYSSFSDKDILEIIANKNDYTEVAISVAYEELNKRNIALEDAESYSQEVKEEKKRIIENKRLGFISKLFYYLFSFTGMGFLTAYLNREDYKKKGSVYKGKQILYYSLFGVGFMFFSIFSSFFEPLKAVALIILPITFIAALLLENKILKR